MILQRPVKTCLVMMLAGSLLFSCGVEEENEVDTPDLQNKATPLTHSILFGENFDTLDVGSQPPNWDNFLGYVYQNTNQSDQSNYALVDDQVAFSGEQSIHFHGTQAQIMRALPTGLERIHMRAFVRLSEPYNNEVDYQIEHLMGLRGDTSASYEIRLGHVMGAMGTSLSPSGNLSPTYQNWGTGNALQANTWYCLESALYADEDYDELYLWVDDELVHSITSDSDWNNGAESSNWSDDKRNYVMFGLHSFANKVRDIWIDDIVVSTGPIGCDSLPTDNNPIPPGEPDLNSGEATFTSVCAQCHGALGKGPVLIDSTKTVYGDANQPLAYFIHDKMPKNDPTLCTGVCARDVAGYIKSWPTSVPPVEPNATTGETLYSENCTGCHGDKGTGNVAIDPSKSAYGDNNQALADFIHDNMPKNNPSLCVGECPIHIAAYIKTWPTTQPTEPNATTGETLYSENCTGCHGDKGTGNVAIDPSKATYGNNQALADFIHDNMPKNNPALCTGDCSIHIAAYIKTWPTTQPTEPNATTGEALYQDNCTGCHGDKGTGNVSIDPSKSAYGDNNQALADFIHDNMPKNNPALCTGDCSIHIAAYIKTWPTTQPHVPDPVAGKNLYNTNCAGCHGDKGTGNVAIDSTKSVYGANNQALADFIHDNMPKNNPALCVGDCSKDIAAYIRTWGDVVVEPISCDVNYGPRMIRILTKNEFSNAIEDLTGINVANDLSQSIYDAIPADNMLNGYSNNVLASIDNGALQSYQLVVDKLVDKLAQTNFSDIIDCSQDANDEACSARFINDYLPKVFRRPLNDEEKNMYSFVFASDFTAGDVNEGFKLATKAAFTSPQFLYRDETGIAVGDLGTGGSGSGDYQQTGTIQTLVDSSDPKTIAIYNQQGSNANFTGNDLVVITVQGVQSTVNGLWPTLSIEAGNKVYAQFEVNHSYAKTYQVHLTDLTGTNWMAIVNKSIGAENEYMGGQNLVLSQWEISGAGEIVQPPPSVDLDDDAYVLTPYQLASYLAFTFTGTTPDDALLAAAGARELETDAQIAAQVERLLKTPRARQHFGNFAAQWLRTDRVLTMAKDASIYPTFTDEIRQAMVQEIRDVFNHVVLDEGEPFTSLYNGNYTFANEALADFYGIGGVTGSAMQKVTGLTSRAGLVTSGAFLTAHAHENETAPILRAVYLRKRMMCHNVPAPPTGVSLGGDDFDEAREQARIEWEKYLAENNGLATARKKYEFQTSGTLCLTCHQKMINPLGGGFEDFNAVGLPQITDYNGLSIDASGTMFGIADINDDASFNFTGAKEVAHAIADLDVTRQCFIDNAFRLAMGTGSELLDPAIDIELSAQEKANYQCEVKKLDTVMTDSGNSTIELLKALGTLDSVRYRKDITR